MGKSKHSKGGNPNSRGSQNPNHNPNHNPNPSTSTSTTNTVKDSSKFSKATPQAQVGSEQKSKTVTSTYPLTQKPQFVKPAIPGLHQQPHPQQHEHRKPFVIPKGGDKRVRDPSQNSKSSGGSLIPPPAKKPYAEVAKSNTNTNSLDMQWPDLQLRIYSTAKNHEHMSYQVFSELKAKLARHTFKFMQTNPDQSRKTYTDGIFYNKVLKCGIVICNNSEALAWYKEAIDEVGGQTFRGWSKEEQVTTCVKIFVPLGIESITSLEYLEALRIMYDTDSTRGIPWTMLKEYIHHSKHTRIIIATIPAEIFTLIQTKGVETSAGSRVWKAIGFMGPLKLTIASENDLRSPNNPKHANKTTKPQNSPPNTLPRSPASPPPIPEPVVEASMVVEASSEVEAYSEVESTPEKPQPLLLKTNPLLSDAASSMSPLHVAMNSMNTNDDEIDDLEGSGDTQEEDMDYGLLTSPNQDTDDFSASWADQC